MRLVVGDRGAEIEIKDKNIDSLKTALKFVLFKALSLAENRINIIKEDTLENIDYCNLTGYGSLRMDDLTILRYKNMPNGLVDYEHDKVSLISLRRIFTSKRNEELKLNHSKLAEHLSEYTTKEFHLNIIQELKDSLTLLTDRYLDILYAKALNITEFRQDYEGYYYNNVLPIMVDSNFFKEIFSIRFLLKGLDLSIADISNIDDYNTDYKNKVILGSLDKDNYLYAKYLNLFIFLDLVFSGTNLDINKDTEKELSLFEKVFYDSVKIKKLPKDIYINTKILDLDD